LQPARGIRRCAHNGSMGASIRLLAPPFQPHPQPPEIFRIDCIRKNHQMFRQAAARRFQIQYGQMRGNEAAAEQNSFVPYPRAGLEFAAAIGVEPQCNQRMPQRAETIAPQGMPGAAEKHRHQQDGEPMRQWRQPKQGGSKAIHSHDQTRQPPGRPDCDRQRLHINPCKNG